MKFEHVDIAQHAQHRIALECWFRASKVCIIANVHQICFHQQDNWRLLPERQLKAFDWPTTWDLTCTFWCSYIYIYIIDVAGMMQRQIGVKVLAAVFGCHNFAAFFILSIWIVWLCLQVQILIDLRVTAASWSCFDKFKEIFQKRVCLQGHTVGSSLWILGMGLSLTAEGCILEVYMGELPMPKPRDLHLLMFMVSCLKLPRFGYMMPKHLTGFLDGKRVSFLRRCTRSWFLSGSNPVQSQQETQLSSRLQEWYNIDSRCWRR